MSLIITPARAAMLQIIARGKFRELFPASGRPTGHKGRLKKLQVFGYVEPEFVTGERDCGYKLTRKGHEAIGLDG